MTFIEPSLQKIYDTLVNNNDLINLLKEKDYDFYAHIRS